MKPSIQLEEIAIRTDLRPGDIGFVTYLHGELYKREYDYGIAFECYVAAGLNEFYQQYDPSNNRVWMGEHQGNRIAFMLLMNRGKAAQLRYFLIHPDYRGIGLGNKLMGLYLEFLKECKYKSSYLWTTRELDTAARLYTKFGFELTEEKESDAFGKHVIQNRYDLKI